MVKSSFVYTVNDPVPVTLLTISSTAITNVPEVAMNSSSVVVILTISQFNVTFPG